MRRLFDFLAGILLLIHLVAHPAGAQLREVRQVIYGMDCAPCARGVEASLQRLEGVQSVKISLNDGTADIRLASDNTQTLERIRQRIADNGFSPKEARVKLTATVQERNGEPVLATTAGEIYALLPGVEAEKVFNRLQAAIGKSLTVVGLIREAKRTESWKMEITQVIE